MSEPAPEGVDPELLDRVKSFSEEVYRLLIEVIPKGIQPLTVTAGTGPLGHVVIEQSEPGGIELTAAGQTLLRLALKFWCAWDSAGHYLAVRQSVIQVYSAVSDTPLFRYDYVATASESVPASHLNIHAHRDEVVFAMLTAGRVHRGKNRGYDVQKGKVPRVSSLHFPLGGHRFRPCLEDVLEFLIREFGLETRESWQSALQASRVTWRERQLKAAIRDDPETAVAALRAAGYSIGPPAVPPTRRLDRLQAL